ncbi:3-oxoacyl-[acyl-carrier-protein] reductase FabG [Andreprevotia sp. IGB-42]|uniref:pteridine reductase n=1 Tax=Andreprevotia sp. IGB-42 TaxID=2497473 RepID=UPI00135CD8FE|nr:pteridine reductase [Andreprevotia sp. IGB-42]KAF0814012.1 3-oxoacyl-[acyl-carrier-protein] reductase FabG [Andreprevotia sp. IGB-42]
MAAEDGRAEERVALITGGAKRVGAAIVRRLHAVGWRVVLHYRASSAEADALADALNATRAGSVVTVQLDLLDTVRLPELVATATAHFGRLDALINNASSFFATPVGTFSEAAWDDLLGSNLKAPLFLAQAAAPVLARTRGSIVSIADIHTERPYPQYILYTVAKAGLVAMTRGLARELAPDVRVNAVAPGSNLWPEHGKAFDAAEQQRIVDTIPLQRIGEPADLAQAIEFLLNAPYLTGVVMPVDGGRSVVL